MRSLKLFSILAAVFVVTFCLFGFGLTGVAAAASVPSPQPGLAVDSVQFWTLAIGSLVPLVTYLINHYGPHVDEKVKAAVLVVVAAVAGALYPLIQSGDWAFDTKHLELVGSAVLAALVAHHTLWKPSGISTALGAGSNVQDDPSR